MTCEAREEKRELQVRPATEADVPRMLELVKMNDPKIPALFAADLDNWFQRGEMTQEHYYVAVVGDLIVGTLGYQPDPWKVASISWLVWGYVDPAWKRRGIASRLLKVIEDRLIQMGCRKLYLDIGNENEHLEAIACWTNRGFVREGYLPDYWEDNEDFLVYAKRLRPKADSCR
jgi:ribosomal protein S18 acetylase RimI-like enzyme